MDIILKQPLVFIVQKQHKQSLIFLKITDNLPYITVIIVTGGAVHIRCNVIAPGGIETEISTSMGRPNMNGYERVQNILKYAPKLGASEDIAKAALYLASDESSYVNGDVLVVDGGWIAG